MENKTGKRERATNFTKSEVRLLTELVAKHRTIIENKKTDAVTNKDKEAAWIKVASLFNAATGITMRSAKTLKFKYESIKKETKKTMAKHRQELYKTGGGPSSGPDFTDVEEKVMAICSNMTGLDARNDSDSIAAPVPEVTKVLVETWPSQPLQPLDNIIILPSDDIPVIDQNVIPGEVPKPNATVAEKENDQDVFDVYQIMDDDIIENNQTQKENNWSTWTPKSLKTKINPVLRPNHFKSTKAGVTAVLDQLSKARLELVEMQKDFARKKHDLVAEEHKIKMLHLQNDERRKQELHEILVRQLSTRVLNQNNILESLK